MIEIRHLTKRFYSVVALNQLSLDIQRGTVLGILGPNGAGKTTLFKLIAGLLNPDDGHVKPPSDGWPTLAYKPDRLIFPNELRVHDYLSLMARVANLPARRAGQAAAEKLARVGLSAAADKPIKELSKGMRQRLGLAQALLGEPEVLLLDEPSNGLDPQGQLDVQSLITELRDEGRTLVLSSHQLNEVTAVCTEIVILNRGQVRYHQPMEQALALRPLVTIVVDRPLAPIQEQLSALHPQMEFEAMTVTLHEEAIQMRRQVLGLLLEAGYDILNLNQQRTSLSDLYARVVQ